MNPIFWLLVFVAAVAFWFVLAPVFWVIGDILLGFWENAKAEIKINEENKEEK